MFAFFCGERQGMEGVRPAPGACPWCGNPLFLLRFSGVFSRPYHTLLYGKRMSFPIFHSPPVLPQLKKSTTPKDCARFQQDVKAGQFSNRQLASPTPNLDSASNLSYAARPSVTAVLR